MMKRILVIAVLFTVSCNLPQNEHTNCVYRINTLFESYDSASFEISRSEGLTEVIDTVNSTGERGIYKFDRQGTLRFYGYLLDNYNNYYFGIEYDTTGHEIDVPKSNVVRWFVSKFGNDSLKISFLLYDINRAYGDIALVGKNIDRKVPLFESKHFSNLIAGDAIIPIPTDKIIYLRGNIKGACGSGSGRFKDSVFIPSEVLNR